jgi:hypothetical protein
VQSLEAIVDFSFPDDHRLLLLLFIAKSRQRGPRLDELYHHLSTRCSGMKYTLTVATAIFSEFTLFNEAVQSWRFGFRALETLLDGAIAENAPAKVEYLAARLLERSPSPKFLQPLSAWNLSLRFYIPLRLDLQGSAFSNPVMLGQAADIGIRVLSKVFLNEFDAIEVSFTKVGGDCVARKKSQIFMGRAPIWVKVRFESAGDWKMDRITLKRGSIAFVWPIHDRHRVIVQDLSRPSVNVLFPHLFPVLEPIAMSIVVTAATFLKLRALSLEFSAGVAIPDQDGVAGGISFSVRNSEISFSGGLSDSADLLFPVNFFVSRGVSLGLLRVSFEFGGEAFNLEFPVSFAFPIECCTRFASEAVVQFSL